MWKSLKCTFTTLLSFITSQLMFHKILEGGVNISYNILTYILYYFDIGYILYFNGIDRSTLRCLRMFVDK